MLKVLDQCAFKDVIWDICQLPWDRLTAADMTDAAWAYYFFSVQFRENLQVAAELYPDDVKLQQLVREECQTSNLSPFSGVASAGEKMDHDEFMKRLLALQPIAPEKQARFIAAGEEYLNASRLAEPATRALTIASYEDGGLESVFHAMLKAPHWNTPLLSAFRHFLAEHIRFDSDPDQGHGALSRHMGPDDRVLPAWTMFRHLFTEFVPALTA